MRANWKVLTAAFALAGCGAPGPSSHRPLITIPASAATVRATGIKQWRLHDYQLGGTRGVTLVGVGAKLDVQAVTRIFRVPVGARRAYAVASLFPAVGRARFSSRHKVLETTLGEPQRAAYASFQRDYAAFKKSGRVPYSCLGQVAGATGACVAAGFGCFGGALTGPLDIAICGAGALGCIGGVDSAIDACSGPSQPPSNPNQSPPSSDPNQNPSTDPNVIMAGGDPNTMGGGDPNAGADPNAGTDPNLMGDPNGGGDPNAGYDPNGSFGAGGDVASCADCATGVSDGSGSTDG